MLEYFKAGRIFYLQKIYELYSKLAFTKDADRPMAISSLEKRILRTLDTRGAYGILELFLERGFLCQRRDDATCTGLSTPRKTRPVLVLDAIPRRDQVREHPLREGGLDQGLQDPLRGRDGWLVQSALGTRGHEGCGIEGVSKEDHAQPCGDAIEGGLRQALRG